MRVPRREGARAPPLLPSSSMKELSNHADHKTTDARWEGVPQGRRRQGGEGLRALACTRARGEQRYMKAKLAHVAHSIARKVSLSSPGAPLPAVSRGRTLVEAPAGLFVHSRLAAAVPLPRPFVFVLPVRGRTSCLVRKYSEKTLIKKGDTTRRRRQVRSGSSRWCEERRFSRAEIGGGLYTTGLVPGSIE